MPEIDTTNKWLIGARGDEIAFMLPPPRQLSKADALLMAAWLVVLADDEYGGEGGQFRKVLEAVLNC